MERFKLKMHTVPFLVTMTEYMSGSNLQGGKRIWSMMAEKS